jgi:hypothetical protein
MVARPRAQLAHDGLQPGSPVLQAPSLEIDCQRDAAGRVDDGHDASL